MYITETVKEYLISRNCRHAVKEYIRKRHPELLASEPWCNLTLTQILVGLSPDQARFLVKVDNENEKIQSVDTMSSEIKVFNKSYS